MMQMQSRSSAVGKRASPAISLLKSSSIRDCDQLPLSRLEHRDWLAPNEALKIFRAISNPKLLVSAFDALSRRRDYLPSEALFSLLIRKLSLSREFHAIHLLLRRIKAENCRLSEDFFLRLIKIFGIEAKHPQQAIETLMAMPEFDCQPTVKAVNLVLALLVNDRQYDAIPEVYLGATKLGVRADTCCFNILINGLCKSGNLGAALHLFDEMPQQGCKPNARSYSTLMHALCQNGKVNDAFDLYGRMEVNGCSPDTVTFNILISGLCREGKVNGGMELLEKMKLKGCSPNAETYQALLYGLIEAGRFVEGKEFMGVMIGKGYRPSYLSCKSVVEGFCRERKTAEAEEVLEEMVRQGYVPRMGTWRKIVDCMGLRAQEGWLEREREREIRSISMSL